MNTITMPTYAIFGGSIFYPSGGFKDIYAFCETFQEALIIYEEALKVGSNHRDDNRGPGDTGYGDPYPCGWAHIVNLKLKKIVVDSRN